MDALNQRNANYFCKLVQSQRIETSAWACTWTMKIGERVRYWTFSVVNDGFLITSEG